MKQYTTENYKELIKNFCEEMNWNKARTNRLLREDIYTKNLYNMTTLGYTRLIMGVCRNSTNPQYLKEARCYLSQFFDWSIKKGYISINPILETPELQYKSLLFQQINLMDIKLITRKIINEKLNQLAYNQLSLKLIVELLWSGCKSYGEIANIKLDDVNFNDKIIKIGNRNIDISDELCDVIKEYIDNENVYYKLTTDGNIMREDNLDFYKGYLYKKNMNYPRKMVNIDIPDDEFTTLNATRIRRELNKVGLDYADVYKSRALYMLRGKLAKLNNEEFTDALLTNSNSRNKKWISRIIREVADYWGFRDNMATMIVPYLVKSEYFQ